MPINAFPVNFLTWCPEQNSLEKPYYLSLANLLEHDIASGKLAPGTRLPPQREIADYLGINFTTVTRAYNLCREKGLIYGVIGSGSFVSAHPGYADTAEKTIELGVVNGFGVLRHLVAESLQNVANKGYLDKLCSYSDPAGLLHQRIAGVRWMAGQGVVADPENTAIFSGAQSIISAALLSCFKVGDRIATDRYTYYNLIGTAHLAHIILEPVDGDQNGMLPDELHKLCSRKNIAGVFLMPNCANPTTVSMDDARRDEIAVVCRQFKLTVIEDDNTALPGLAVPLFSRLPEQTVYISSSAIAICGGLRVAYCAFSSVFRERLLGALRHLSIKTSSIDAELMTELVNSGKAGAIIQEKRQLASRANAVFSEVFPEYADPALESSLFRCIPLPEPFWQADGKQIEEYFRSRGVNVYHSYRFAVGKCAREKGFIRVSLSSTANNEELKQGLLILKDALSSSRQIPHF